MTDILPILKKGDNKSHSHKMVKHPQTIRWQCADELFESDHFVGLALKGLNTTLHM